MSVKNRYDFVLFFEVVNGTPNGDPDAGGMPRIDQQTSHGLVTDGCIKRKIRNYVEMVHQGEDGYDIFITENAALNAKMQKTYEDHGLDPKNGNPRALAQEYMCKQYFDVRTFGAVMDTGDYKCGKICGPVQLCFARSVDPVYPQEITITRIATTDGREDPSLNHTLGRKYIVPYGLYRMEGFFSPMYAARTGFSDKDLDMLWEAMLNMFEFDHSASRGRMATRKLILFEHESILGNAPSFELFDLVRAESVCGDRPPRAFEDYNVSVGTAPAGVTVRVLR